MGNIQWSVFRTKNRKTRAIGGLSKRKEGAVPNRWRREREGITLDKKTRNAGHEGEKKGLYRKKEAGRVGYGASAGR